MNWTDGESSRYVDCAFFFFNSFGSNLWVRLFNHLLIWLLLVVTDIMDTDFFLNKKNIFIETSQLIFPMHLILW